MTRNGKIARLSRHLRETLNCRLRDGEPGVDLVAWLNSLQPVQEMLEARFAGRPVNEQNLSDWKQGGYEEWLRHQEAREAAQALCEEAQELSEDINGEGESSFMFESAGDQLSVLLGVELTRQAKLALTEAKDPQERWERLRELLKLVGDLRKDDHRQVRLRMDTHLWERDLARRDKEEEQASLRAEKQKILAPIWAQLQRQTLAEAFGGGPGGGFVADFIQAVNLDLPLPEFKPANSAATKGDPVEKCVNSATDQNRNADPKP